MTYGYENLKLEKGMYAQSGKSFSRVLESLDPSENYRGTALEGLDAFQRQLKRFDIHVKGAGSDMVEKLSLIHICHRLCGQKLGHRKGEPASLPHFRRPQAFPCAHDGKDRRDGKEYAAFPARG